MRIVKTPYFSYRIGQLPKGCRLCVKGEKLVLFETGLCSKNCFYCPISEQKKNKDIIYANEWQTKKISDIIKEAELCGSKGAGITGGDPLTRVNRTVKHIKALKKRFGNSFHIHLYAPLTLITKSGLRKLCKAGLDEIRLHPDLDNDESWHKISWLKEFKWDKGIEIPVIPGKEKQTKKLLDFVKDKVDFINLNELELSDTNASNLSEMGFVPKERLSYAVKGSEELAKKLLSHCLKNKFRKVHYCTVKLKDGVQLFNRIRRRAKNARQPSDIVMGNGILLRGAVYLQELRPEFSYRKKITAILKNRSMKAGITRKLNKTNSKLRKELKNNDFAVDKNKLRIITSAKNAIRFSSKIKELGLVPAIVEEYPTWDGFEVSIEFL